MPVFCLCTLAWLFHFWNCNYRGFRTNEVRRVNSARKKKPPNKRENITAHTTLSLSVGVKGKKQKEEKTIIRSGKLGGLQNSQDLYQWAQLTFWTGIRAGKLTKNERYNHNHTISCESEHPRETNIGGTQHIALSNHAHKQPNPELQMQTADAIDLVAFFITPYPRLKYPPKILSCNGRWQSTCCKRVTSSPSCTMMILYQYYLEYN